MKTRKQRFTLVIMLMIMTLIFTACSSGSKTTAPATDNKETATPAPTEGTTKPEESKKPSSGKIVRKLAGLEAKTLNPHTVDNSTDADFLTYIAGNLLELIFDKESNNIKFIPNHATELPTNKDGKVWTFKLKDNIKWTDGTPITAKTYDYSLRMLLDQKLASRNASGLFEDLPIVNASNYFQGKAKWEDVGIKALDDRTLEITLETAMPEIDVLTTFAGGGSTSPVHEKLYEAGMKADRTETTYGTALDKIDFSGTYRMTEWVRDQFHAFDKIPDSPLANVYIPDRIEDRTVSENATRLQLFEKGEIDNVTVSGENFDKYADDPRLVYQERNTVWGFFINSTSDTNPILKNNDFRKALFLGIDREKIAKGVFNTYAAAPYYLSSPNMVGDYKEGKKYRETEEGKAVLPSATGYDVEAAKSYFDKAYQANGNKKITFEIVYFDGQGSMKQTAEVAEEQYEKLFGTDKLDITLKAMPPSAAYDAYRDGKYDLGLGAMGQNPFNPWGSLRVWTSDFPEKSHRFANKQFDELYDRTTKGDLLLKPDERLKALAEMEKMLIDYVPQVPIFQNNNAVLYQDSYELVTGGKYFPVIGFAPLQAIITK